MSDYTPTTDEVRENYGTDSTGFPAMRFDYEVAEFDRWLAAYDEQVRADERERIAQAIEASRPPGLPNVFQDPLQVYYSAGLGDAARIARQGGDQ